MPQVRRHLKRGMDSEVAGRTEISSIMSQPESTVSGPFEGVPCAALCGQTWMQGKVTLIPEEALTDTLCQRWRTAATHRKEVSKRLCRLMVAQLAG